MKGLPTSFAVRPVRELVEAGDVSVRSVVRTHGPEYYEVPASFARDDDRRIANVDLKKQFLSEEVVRTPPRYLVHLTDCFVLPNAAIVTRSGNILEESCFPYQTVPRIGRMFAPWLEAIGNAIRVEFGDVEEVSSPAIYLREHGEMGFFHWMHSVLPRVDILEENGFSPSFGMLCQGNSGFQRQSLAMCGLGDAKRLAPSRDRVQWFSELVFPSPLVQGGDFWLRPLNVGRFYDKQVVPTPTGPRRIYVTRSDAQMRRLVNEGSLLDLLTSLRFEPVELSALSFPEQVGLFRSCEFVAGVHGAGLSHIVNLPPTAGVLEILHPRRFWATYRAMSARRGVRYGFAVGEDKDASVPGDSFDFNIDVGKVAEVLRTMGLS